jgi:membrane protease YdiL (CAAX protease family)
VGAARDLARRHPVATYVGLAWGVSWCCWLPLVVSGSVVRQGDPWPTDLLGLTGPAVAAAVTLSLTGGGVAVRAWASRMLLWRCPWWTWGCAVGTLALGLGALWVRDGTPFPVGVSAYTGAPDLGFGLTFLLVLAVNGFGEEAGWRGYLADRLLPRHGLLRTATYVTVPWALWHAPLFLVIESFRSLGLAVVGWAIGLYAGSIVLTWLYAVSGRSILLVAVWHTAYNLTSATTAAGGVPAALTTTVVMVAAVAIVVVERRHRAEDATPGRTREAVRP